MATVSYANYYESRQAKSTATKKDFKVGYFNSLKTDGDEAIVRFAYNTVDDFNIQTVHTVEIDGSFRKVACLRGSIYDSEDKCPLCASGNKFFTKVYLKLVEYKNEDGKIVGKAETWERPANFISKVVNAYKMAVDMGIRDPTATIGDVVFKVTRSGTPGAKTTDYTVAPLNPKVYKDEIYVKNFDDFKDLDLAHHSYSNKTYDEIKTFLETGKFPAYEKKTSTTYVDTKSPELDVEPDNSLDASPVESTKPASDSGEVPNTIARSWKF